MLLCKIGQFYSYSSFITFILYNLSWSLDMHLVTVSSQHKSVVQCIEINFIRICSSSVDQVEQSMET